MIRQICLISVLLPLASCQSWLDRSKKEPAAQAQLGRYQILTSGSLLLKLDTITGQTWMLDGGSVWQALNSADKAREIARLALTMDGPAYIEDPKTGKMVTETPESQRQRVEKAIDRVLNEYERLGTTAQPVPPVNIAPN